MFRGTALCQKVNNKHMLAQNPGAGVTGMSQNRGPKIERRTESRPYKTDTPGP